MSYALSRPPLLQRSSLLMLVIGLHVIIFLLILAAKTVIPQIMEIPLVVDLLQAPEPEKEPEAKPLPMAKPVPLKPHRTPTPKAPAPVIEATQSTTPAPAAPIATPPKAEPEAEMPQAAPPAEPVSAARFDADYLNNPAPPYPPLSRRMSEEGKVVLRVSVNPQGAADSVEVRTSSGSTRLDDAAVNTVKRWKFIPAKRGESAVQSWVLVPIIFKLEH
ncbi:MAG: TonB family protein [Rhodocyclaceae bacterium]|nr:TonB family protein [Rhodocyclaceae bacterium]